MHIVIIGNGISGVTAARWVRKLSEHKITIISSETEYFYSRTALMYIYMGHMRQQDTQPYEPWFWAKNRIELLHKHVDSVAFEAKELSFSDGSSLAFDKLIIATGSKSNKFGWPGQDLNGVGGLYHIQDLERMNKYSHGLQKAVIVGGGLIGIEMAEMFNSRKIPVTMLVREESYWNNVLPTEESAMINKHIKKHHIDLRLGVNLQEITSDDNGNANGIIIKETGEKIDCGFVGLTAGVSPNIQFLKDSGLETGRGILVDKFLETNIKDVYAIGDCAEQRSPMSGRRGVEAIWYTGRMMGETVAYNVCDKAVSYDPGIWFNSAKFLDIEYQVYGNIQAKPPENHGALYWQHQTENKSIRIVYDVENMEVLGFNLMGIRYRHEVCEKWIKERTPIESVLKNLSLANFDPEFYEDYETELVFLYNSIHGANLKLEKKRKWDFVRKFLSQKV